MNKESVVYDERKAMSLYSRPVAPRQTLVSPVISQEERLSAVASLSAVLVSEKTGDLADRVVELLPKTKEPRFWLFSGKEKKNPRGLGSDKRGEMPIDWLPLLMPETTQYMFGMKDDGVRSLLVVLDGGVFLLVHVGRTYDVIQVVSRKLHDATTGWRLTILDGELVGGGNECAFIASSCIFRDGSPAHYLSFRQRYELTKQITRKLEVDTELFYIRCKPVWADANEFAKATQHLTDTLLWSDPVIATTKVDGRIVYLSDASMGDEAAILKYKDVRTTVDFSAKPMDNWMGLYIYEDLVHLSPLYLFDPWKRQNGIYECKFDRGQCVWKPVKPRRDKTKSNSLKVLNDALMIQASVFLSPNSFYSEIVKRATTGF
jgi:hypothetical protein